MDTNKIGMAIFLALFIWFGCMFLFWFSLDRWLSWKEKRSMRNHHIHHIILGLWPLLTTYLGFHFYGKYSFQSSLIFVILTAGVYFFFSLWDVRYERIHNILESWSSPLLSRFAMSYPLLMMIFSCIVLTTGLVLLVITPLNLSKDTRSFIGFLALVCDCIVFYFIFKKFIPSWEKQSRG